MLYFQQAAMELQETPTLLSRHALNQPLVSMTLCRPKKWVINVNSVEVWQEEREKLWPFSNNNELRLSLSFQFQVVFT